MKIKIQIRLLFILFLFIVWSNVNLMFLMAQELPKNAENKTNNSAALTIEPKSNSAHNNGKVKWYSNLNECLEAAKAENKLVLVDAVASWCGWCKKMEMETFKNPEIIKELEKYVCLRVIVEDDAAFSGKYTVNEFPTILFLKADGSELERHIGFKNVDDFKKIIGQIDEKKVNK